MIKYILLIILITLYFINRWKNRKFYKLSKCLSNDLITLPYLGIAYLFFGGGQAILRGVKTVGRETLKQKGITSIWFAGRCFVVIADPILADHTAKSCITKDEIIKKCVGIVLGNCNFVAPESIWRIRRKVLVPTFKPNNLKQYVTIFSEQSEILVEKLRPTLNKPVAVLDHLFKYNMESLCQSILGTKTDAQNKPHHPFILGLQTSSKLIGERCLKPWLHCDLLYQLLPQYTILMKAKRYGDQFIAKVIRTHRKRMQEEEYQSKPKNSDKCILELLIENSSDYGGYSDIELNEETLGLAVAGIDTTAISSGFVCHMLATHSDVQEKVFAELEDIFKDHEHITSEDLPRLKYLNIVIKETLRLFPVLPIVSNKLDSDCELPSGVTLPRGCGIIVHYWAINRNPEYWGADAELFRPERFLEDSLKHPAQFATFGLGPRLCIGNKYAMMSMLTTFATLLRQYRILPARSASDAGAGAAPGTDSLRLTYGVAMKDITHFPVVFEQRKG